MMTGIRRRRDQDEALAVLEAAGRMLMGRALAGLLVFGLLVVSGQPLAEEMQPSGPPAAAPLLGVVGIGVRDIERSAEFYRAALGLQEQRRYELGHINEIVLGFPDGQGPGVVLMNWPGDAERRYDGNDVKLVFYVDDPAAVLARVVANGGRVDLEAQPLEVLNGKVVGLGRDLDNYVIEVIGR